MLLLLAFQIEFPIEPLLI